MRIRLLGPAPIVSNLNPLGNYLVDKLKYYGSIKGKFRFMVAYAQETFMGVVGQALKNFVKAGGSAEAIIGVDSHGTSAEALKALNSLMGPGNLFVYHNPADATFHPKLYIFVNATEACVVVGSSNLTIGGLANNFEVNVAIELDLNEPRDCQVLRLFDDLFDSIKGSRSSRLVTPRFLATLKKTGSLQKRDAMLAESSMSKPARTKLRTLFKSTAHARTTIPIARPVLPRPTSFIMSLSEHDVSRARGEPYFLIPVAARDQNPRFWGWQRKFSPSRRGRFPERHFPCVVHIDSRRATEEGRLYYFAGRDEFRFKCAAIHQLGKRYAGSFIVLKWRRNSRGQDIANIRLVTQNVKEYERLAKLPLNVHAMGKKWTYI